MTRYSVSSPTAEQPELRMYLRWPEHDTMVRWKADMLRGAEWSLSGPERAFLIPERAPVERVLRSGALNELLADIVEEADFEITRTEVTDDGKNVPLWSRRVSASELREFYLGQQVQVVRSSASVYVPDALMSQLEGTLRQVLNDFVDPETDRIGHVFPTAVNNSSYSKSRPDGLLDERNTSPLPDFSRSLVQAAAIMGVERVMKLLMDWKRGEPIRLYLSTVLNNLFLETSLSPRADIRVVPLPLTTTELPRVPVMGSTYAKDYLGLTLLQLDLMASPALFRPMADSAEETVRSRAVDGVNLDLICEALSLRANRHVSKSVVWSDYPDAAGFCLRIPSSHSYGDDRLQQAPMKSGTLCHETGVATITLADDVSLQRLDESELRHTLEALMRADRKLRIATERWRRSKRPNVRPEDAYIDLRIALESLYLKDFANEHSQEMRFRLALFGAWHLAGSLDERRSIRKVLRDAYDTASRAVHVGELSGDAKGGLSDAQDLCRRGILKLLHEGPPPDWGDLVLGA